MSARADVSKRVRNGQAALGRAATATAGLARPRRDRAAASALPAPEQAGVAPAELLVRRDGLARRLAELQWDLGGLTYEMAIRDHFRLDVLVRAAGELQAVDGELAEIERLLRLEQAGAGGTCPECGALHARGAPFCWRCGTALMGTRPVSPA